MERSSGAYTPSTDISANLTFFAGFPEFKVYLNHSDAVNFGRLAYKRQWKLNGKTWRKQWCACFGEAYTFEMNPYKDSYFVFFKSFHGFVHDETKPMSEEFERLGAFMGWKGKEKATYRNQVLTTTIQGMYGGDAGKLDGWKLLCEEVGIIPAPETITKCRKALKNVYVNLFDLADYRTIKAADPNAELRKFKSYSQLKNYSIKNKKLFNKKAAKEDGFMSGLLKSFF